jgi:RimJ/RimL family protein N-acetyltransferase
VASFEPREFPIKGGSVVVRSARPERAAAQLAFAREMYRTSPYVLTVPDEFTMTEDQEARFLRERLESPAAVFLNAEHGDEIVGSLDLAGHTKRKIAHQALLGMGIAEAWRGRGVGDALMRAALEWATAHPTIEIVTLGVFAVNEPARKLYLRHGFVEFGRLPRALKQPEGGEFENIDMYKRVKA